MDFFHRKLFILSESIFVQNLSSLTLKTKELWKGGGTPPPPSATTRQKNPVLIGLKDQRDLNLKYGNIEIKQHGRVTYLGCILDNILSGEHMAAKVLNTVNNRRKFLCHKQKFLSLILGRLLCNALIQPHFDYACAAWYPLLNKRQSKSIQIAQNKCIRYCLNLDNKAHIGTNEFFKINWLPTNKRVEQCICVNVFKSFNQMSPQYTAKIFHPSSSVHNTHRATQKLDLPFRKSCIGHWSQNTFLYWTKNME